MAEVISNGNGGIDWNLPSIGISTIGDSSS